MGTECPLCHGTGFRLETAEGGVVASSRCECERADRDQRRLRAARIPRRYEHCTFEHYTPIYPALEEPKRIARAWAEEWPLCRHGLLLLGNPGTGKTHLLVAIAREIVSKGGQVLFWEQRELLKALQGTYDSGADLREVEVLGPVLEAEVLVLDDLGAGRTTAWTQDVMHDVIAHRYNRERLMLISSNHPTGDEPEERRAATSGDLARRLSLRDRLGDPLMSRIYEMCRVVPVGGKDGQDYRQIIQNAKFSR